MAHARRRCFIDRSSTSPSVVQWIWAHYAQHLELHSRRFVLIMWWQQLVYNFVPCGLCLTIFICVHGGPLQKYHWTIDSHPGVTTCEWCWGIAKRSHWGQGVSWYVRYFAILTGDLDDGQLVILLMNIDQPRRVNKSLMFFGFQGCLTTEIRETSSNHSFESFFFISF